MIQRIILICFFLLTLIPLSTKALPPPSPAGGGMLQLDRNHDFVATIEAWFPDEEFDGLTAEAWLYFEEPPKPLTFWSIFGQEGRFNLIIHGNGMSLGAWGDSEDADGELIIGGQPLPKEKWLHVVAIYDASAGKGFNGMGGNWCCPGGHLIKSDEPLQIGGIVVQDPDQNPFIGDNVKLRGYIDEARISNTVRYVGPKWEIPKGKFEVDEHTISLWHFDEKLGSMRFEDASGNGYNLWRKGLAVEAQRKLTTTWGHLKQ